MQYVDSGPEIATAVGVTLAVILGKLRYRHFYRVTQRQYIRIALYNNFVVMSVYLSIAYQRAALILRCFECRDPLPLFSAFTVYVRPILEYCSPV